MSRPLGITVLGGLLLAAWLVFFAWPPVRPLRTYRAVPAAGAGLVRAGEALRALELPEPMAEPDPPGEAAPRARTAVAVSPGTRRGRVRVHGRLTRQGVAASDYDLVFLRRGTSLIDGEAWDVTDSEGGYEVRLAPGRYVVVNDDAGPFLTNVDVPASAELELDIELPTGVLRGRVVRAETGAASSLARVVALRVDAESDSSDAITQALMARGGETRTLPDGSFELAEPGPGRYVLTAESGGVITSPVRVVVPLADASVDDLVLTLRRGSRLRGVVRGPENEPVAMELWLCPGTQLNSLTQLATLPEHASNGEGEFVIEGLQPGPYVLFGRGGTSLRDLTLQARIDFRSGEPPLELTARACGTLSITILGRDGAPVPGAHIDLRAYDGGVVPCSLEWLEEGPASDARGRIVLEDVMPGRYRLTASAPGRSGSPTAVEVRPERTTGLTLSLD